MKVFLCVLAIAGLFAFGGAAAADSSASCPNDITLDDSAWVLRAIQAGDGAGGGEYVYTMWKRIFAYQPDVTKRFRKEFSPACFGEAYSFVINGKQQWIAKRIVSLSGSRAFLLLSDNTWREGSGVHVAADFKNPIGPAYYVLLFRASEVVAHRKISIPIVIPSLSLQSDQ